MSAADLVLAAAILAAASLLLYRSLVRSGGGCAGCSGGGCRRAPAAPVRLGRPGAPRAARR